MTGHTLTRNSRDAAIGTTVTLGVVVLLALFPLFGSASTQLTLIEVFYFLSLAQMWNLLAGFGGLVSVGQQGFVGIAAYTTFVLAEKNGLDPFLALVLAGVIVAVFSVPVAAFAFRLQGGYFAIGTWVIAEVFRLATLQIDSLGAGNVQSFTVRNTFANYDIDLRRDVIYWVALALAAGATFIVVFVLRSRLGLALRAVRDNPDGASGLGVNVTRARLTVWVMAAAWTGATGALIHLNSSTVTNRDAFSVLDWTALVIFIVIIGGVGSTTGPIIGVAIFWFISEQFEDADTWRFIILGGVAAVMAVFAPRGVYGLIQQWRPFQLFPVRARLRGPGLD
ncbi:MAG: branched-chain amino acid ABC transporter permease [Actinomycetota bacterium]